MADPALGIFGHPTWTPDQKRAALERLGDYEQTDEQALAEFARGARDTRVAGTPHQPAPAETPAERFDRFDQLGTGPQSAPMPPRSSAPAAFARSAAAGALDAAMLPVTVPAKLYRAAGGRGEALDTVADLSADEALQDATWLATGEDAADYRRRVAREREEFPNASAAGTELGATIGGLGLEGLAGRGLSGVTRSVVYHDTAAAAENAAKRLGGKKRVTQSELERFFGADARVTSALGGQGAKELDFYVMDPPFEYGPAPRGSVSISMHGSGKDAAGTVDFTLMPDKRVRLDLIKIPEEHSGQGLTKGMLSAQIEALDRLGVRSIELTAGKDGKVVWPKLGFRPAPEVEARMVAEFNERFGGEARTLQDVSRLSGGERFLRDQPDFALSADLTASGPGSLREALGLPAPAQRTGGKSAAVRPVSSSASSSAAQSAPKEASRSEAPSITRLDDITGNNSTFPPGSRAAKREATREAVRREVAAAGGLATAAKPWEPGRTRALEKAFAGATPEEATEIATGRALPREPDYRHNAGQKLPPVRVVVRTDVPPGKPPEIKFADGNHRTAAAKAAGASEILAEVEVLGRNARGGEKVLHRYKGPVPLLTGDGVVTSRARSGVHEQAHQRQREFTERDLLDVYAHPTWTAEQKRWALEQMGAH